MRSVTIPFFYRVSREEEEMMIGQFGDEYAAYRNAPAASCRGCLPIVIARSAS